jgi:hypothetical protein
MSTFPLKGLYLFSFLVVSICFFQNLLLYHWGYLDATKPSLQPIYCTVTYFGKHEQELLNYKSLGCKTPNFNFCLALTFFCKIVKGENMIWGGGQLGQFHDMCIMYTPPKCVAFRFHFWCLGLYFDFHKDKYSCKWMIVIPVKSNKIILHLDVGLDFSWDDWK